MRNAALALLLALSVSACKHDKVETRLTVEEIPVTRLPSSIQMGDAAVAAQLVSGFHEIEDSAWRWTQRQFSASLGTPAGAAQKGAVLALKLTIPPVIIEKLKTVTLTASVNGADLPPETYSRAGNDTYRRDVPANLLGAESTKVDFRLDKAMAPAGGDARELGIIVLGISLESR